MMEHNKQFDNLDRHVSDRFRQDLRSLFQPPGPVPRQTDKTILDQARTRLAKPHRLIIHLRWAAGIAAAAAVIALGLVLFNVVTPDFDPGPQSTIRNPQSPGPVLAEGRADVDGNGRVDILDAFRLARSIEAQAPVDERWDLNGDGRLDQDDVDLVASAAVRLESDLRGEGILPLRVAGILPAVRGRDALDTQEQGQDGLATQGRDALATSPFAVLLGKGV
jgi:hypothetical protein